LTNEPVALGRLWALMLTVFVDMVGLLIVIPLLPFFATRLGASAFLVGLMVSAYAIAQLATAPLWGRASDRHGRRPMLMLGVSIATLAHLLFAFASSNWAMSRFDNLSLILILFISRFVQGGGGATTGVVQAYIGDAVIPEERAKALGWISAATSAGVMLGPAIGSLASVASPALPGLIAAGLCVVNLIFARRYLPESSSIQARADARAQRSASVRTKMAEILLHPRRPVARLVWVYTLGMMSFMAMNAILALFLLERFGFTEKSIGWAYTAIGTISLLMRSVILGPAIRRLGEIGVMRVGIVALAASFALQPLAPSLWVYALTVVLVPVGTALLFPATSSLVSRFAERSELGVVMGVQQAYGGMARLIGPVWAGAAFEAFGAGSPFYISAVLAIAMIPFVLGLEPPPRPQAAPPAEAPVPASG
jgi:MFS family permease